MPRDDVRPHWEGALDKRPLSGIDDGADLESLGIEGLESEPGFGAGVVPDDETSRKSARRKFLRRANRARKLGKAGD